MQFRQQSILLCGLLAAALLSSTLFAANVAPKFRGGPDIVLIEDSPGQTVPNWATSITSGGADEQAQQLTFVVTNNNHAMFEEQPEISPTGVLHFVPARDAFGTAVVRVILQDDGGTEDGGRNTSPSFSFLITIRPVNDPPTFVAGSDVSVIEDSGVVSLPRWATDLSVGPTNEVLQRLSFVLTVNHPELFAKPPTVNSTGTLNFTTARNAFGDSAVTIFAVDSGGAGNGGKPTSDSATFVISVTPVNDPPSMAKIPDVLVPEDSPATVLSNWVKQIVAGPTNEAEQSLEISVTNDNAVLFDVPPAVTLDGKLSFTPAHDAYGVAQVTVKLSDDAGKTSGGADTSAPQTFKITIRGINDPPTFSGGADQTVLEDSGPKTVPNWATNITVGSPKEVPDQRISGFVATNDSPSLFAHQPAVDLTGTLSFTPAPDAFGTAQITVRAKDNGPDENGLNLSAPYQFKVQIEAVNDRPRIASLTNITVLEDSGRWARTNWAKGISAGPTNERSQGLTITAITTNTALFSAPPAMETNGTLSFTPAPDASGVATVTVTLKDNGGTNASGIDSIVTSFDIIVEAVNDRPSFTKGADQVVVTGAGEQRVVGWVTNISVGPPDELKSQRLLGFVVTNGNPSLFLRQPTIGPDGTLTYHANRGSIGTATARASAKDDGGTNRGGLDTTTNQTFTITVNPALDPPSFAAGTNLTVSEDSGAHTLTGWAKQIRLGPTNIPGLKLGFKTVVSEPRLFSVQPAVDASGTLTFSLATNAFGEATISLSASHSGGRATGGVQTSATNTFTVTVQPVNDPPSFGRIPTNVMANEDAGPLAFTNWARGMSVGPTNESAQKLSFTLTNDQPRLFEVQPMISPEGTLTFTTTRDAAGAADVEVKLVDDGGRDRAGNDTAGVQRFAITIREVNDPPTFHAGRDPSVLEDSGKQSILRWATELSVGSKWEEASQKFEGFTLVNDNPALFASELILDPQGNLGFTPATNAFGTAHVAVRGRESGPGTEGMNLGAPHTLTITVEPVNDRPAMEPIQSVALLEDAGRVSLTNWVKGLSAGPTNESSQQMTLTTSAATTNRLFADAPSIDAVGTLTFTTSPDATGRAIIAATLQDNGGTNSGGKDSFRLSFEVLVRPVNDPPRFSKGPDQAILNTAGLQRVAKWATGLSVGPADEAAAGQKLQDFVVRIDNPELFSRLPAVDEDGTLTYRPAIRHDGVATVTVQAKDNGGNADGGSDLSEPQTFKITVAAPPGTRGFSTNLPSWMTTPPGR